MKFAFIIDPIHHLDPAHDTSVALMEAAYELGHEVWITQASQLSVQEGKAGAKLTSVQLHSVQLQQGRWVVPQPWYELGVADFHFLEEMDAVFMRTDPPVTIPYLYATHILDYINPNKTLVVNAPAGLRTANEKMYALRFPEFMPETIVTAKKEEIQAFLAEKGKVILKPLAGKAGEGILVLVEGDRNFNSLVELSTHRGQLPVMVQDFLSAASEGDKRIMLLDGEPIGAINRVPAANDYRGNMAVGGSVAKTEITAAEWEMCQKMTPTLRQDGLYFVGIDIIGGCLTEVNVTSPTGLREIQRLENNAPAHRTIEWTVQRVQSQCDRSEAAQIG